ILLSEQDNWYLDPGASEKDFPNKYPGRWPFRSSLQDAPPAPESLRRLAWQTDQMRKGSENDTVRVQDWSRFSQYVKKHYYEHGIECTVWSETGRGKPLDPKPPSRQPRPLPAWICSLLQRERQLPGPSLASRELPFASGLRASGTEAQQPLEFKGAPPKMQELYPEFPRRTVPVEAPRAAVNPRLRLPFREWLKGMDDSLFLLQYHDHIAANFDSLEQIHEIYFQDGEIKPAFFE
ncbi:unnamed protein product, partial [Polarella glacialis]